MTSLPQLTPFQLKAEGVVVSTLASVGRERTSRDVLRGMVPFFSAEEQVVVRISSNELVILVHDDEITFSSPQGSGGLERADFPSDDELLAAFVNRVRAVLSKS